MKKELEYIQATPNKGHHFFGYYDKQQFDVNDRYLLTKETSFIDRSPKASDKLDILILDSHNSWKPKLISTTYAWCWQQGSMLQWVPQIDDTIMYNDRIGDRFVSKFINVKTDAAKVLPRAVYTLSNNGFNALSLNFSRNAYTRPR